MIRTDVEKQAITVFRSWEEEKGKDLVSIPRALALDLVSFLSEWTFGAVASEEDLEAGLHERRAMAHKDKMERIETTVSMHLSHEGITPDANAMLRGLALAYEAAEDIDISA